MLTKVSIKNNNEIPKCIFLSVNSYQEMANRVSSLPSSPSLLSSHTQNYLEANPGEIMMRLQLAVCMTFNHVVTFLVVLFNIQLYLG